MCEVQKSFIGLHRLIHARLQVYDEILAAAKAGEGFAGSFFWSAVGPAFAEPDAFSLKLAPIPRRQAEGLGAHISYLVEGSGTHLMQRAEPEEDTLELCSSHMSATERSTGRDEEDQIEAVIRIIMDHASQMSSLNVSWLPECPVM